MNIIVNGKELTYNTKLTLAQLLKELKVEDKVMAIAINMEIVKKDDWNKTSLKEGDKVELLHFVGGG